MTAPKVQDTRAWRVVDLDTRQVLVQRLMESEILDDLAGIRSRAGAVALRRLRVESVELSKHPHYWPESYEGEELLRRVELWVSIRAGIGT